jgi:tetratricopeptide (TPR) repeat protein
MPKKKSSRASKTPSVHRRVAEDLYEANQLLEDGEPEEACEILEELDRRYPGKAPVLEMLVNAYYDLKDMHGYEYACYRLCKVDPDNADLTLAMGGAYLNNYRPALAVQTFEKFVRRWSGHERAGEARQTLEQIREGLKLELEELGLTEAEAFELARTNEEVRFFLDHGLYPQGRLAADRLLKRYPDFVPGLNNLSQIHALQGESARAIELCRRVLEIEPDNIHGLSNLTRLLFLGGQPEEAVSVAERLKASQAPAADFWTKKAEPFAIMGDDQAVLELYKKAKAAKALEPPDTSPLFFHMAAVAYWQQGNDKEARRLWQKALDLQPGFDLAQQQLKDLEQPPARRNGVFAFSLNTWVTGSVIRELTRTVEPAARRKQENAIQIATDQFLQRHPELVSIAPHLLQRGDPLGRDFVINLAGMSHHPQLLELIKDFALGQRGTDKQRMKASQIVSEVGMLPSGAVRMWMQGEWHDVLLLNFEISGEIDENPYTPEVAQLAEEAYHAMQDDDPKQAQQLLEQAIALQPDSPMLLNNLAKALDMQGEEEKAHAMLLDIHQRFPDYFFGIVSMARIAMQAGDHEKTRNLLNGLMQRKKLHYSEYDALCMAQIDLSLAEKNKEAARSWFEMWERPDPENPKLEMYRLRLGLADSESVFKKLMRRGK